MSDIRKAIMERLGAVVEGAKAAFAVDAGAVAKEILRQLGGGRFMSMVGGKNAMHGMFNGKPGLQVSIGKGAEGGINRLIVTLDPATDTYDMEFWRIANRGLSTKKVSEAHGVYADDLQRVFTDRTKFYTSMSRPGAKERMQKEYVLWGIPKGKTSALDEQVLSTQAKTPAQMDAIKKRAAADGWHSFRVQILDLSKPYKGFGFARPGEKAKMARWEESHAEGWGDLSKTLTATINGTRWTIVVDASTGKGQLMRSTGRGPQVVKEGAVDQLKRYAETARASRPGAKATMAVHAGALAMAQANYSRAKRELDEAQERLDAFLRVGQSEQRIAQAERGVEIAEQRFKDAEKALRSLNSRPGAKATAAKPDDTEREDVKAGLKLMEKADKAVSDKIRTLIKEGKPQDQAVAIALDMKRRGEL